MGTLLSSLNIAHSGMQAAQVQLDTAGHNIANVNREGFSRQRVLLSARTPLLQSYGYVGRGVQIDSIARTRDAFLDQVYRKQTPGLGYAEARAVYFGRVEDIFQEPQENAFSARINEFWDALNDFSNNVEELPVRLALLQSAQNLAGSLNTVAERIYTVRTNANEEIKALVPKINTITQNIADLNRSIRDIEVGSAQANDLRDQRDLMLDELSQIVGITYRERTDGQVDIVIGGDLLVESDKARQIAAVRNAALDIERGDLVEIRFADDNKLVNVNGGQLEGALVTRDEDLVTLKEEMDNLAQALIQKMNRIHSQGNGIKNLYYDITSSVPISDETLPLTSLSLPFPITAGTFNVLTYDSTGNAVTNTITVDNATTLTSLAAQLDALPNMHASVIGTTLRMGADSGYTYSFNNDSSGILVGLGLNGFFTGTDASTIAINPDLEEYPMSISSAYDTDILNTGDNKAALDMVALRTLMVLDSNSATINDYYEGVMTRVGIESKNNADRLEVERSFVDEFNNRRQEVSGVSLDEEVTYMMQFQRAFEASARVITTADRMLDTLLSMAR